MTERIMRSMLVGGLNVLSIISCFESMALRITMHLYFGTSYHLKLP